MLIFTLFYSKAFSQISGTVFRDFNNNGTKDNSATYNEPFVSGVVVKAFNTAGAEVGSTTTNTSGAYSFTGLTLPLRIEFGGLQTGDYSAPTGSGNKSSEQFYIAASSTANFGINYPQHYTSATNPYYIVSQFEANRPPSSEPLATAMLKQQYDTRGNGFSTYAPSIAKTSEIGSTWAVAYDRKNNLIYAAAFAKRHASLKDNDADGKEDLGAIYSMTTSGSPALWKDLSTLGIDFGTSLLPTIAARALPTTILGPCHDAAMFSLVGKIGIGGVTLSDDFTKMYVMNLYDKKIYTIDIATKTLIATSSVVPNSCASGNSRPFALKYHRGKVYVGAVCDAATSGNFNDLSATVYSYDGTSFTSIINYPLNYVKGYTFKDFDDNNSNGLQEEWGKQWNAWSDVMPSSVFTSAITVPASQVLINPQPMLVDLEFDIDESLIMVFNDRFGHQAGQVNYGTNTSNITDFYTGLAAGDMLRASYSAGTYTLENGGIVGGLTGNTTNANGPGGGEFYHGDHDIYNYHAENIIGGSFLFAGKNEVATVVTDPIGYWAGGVFFFDNTNGNVVDGTDNYQLYQTTLDNTKFGKVNGLGDIELISAAPPIEIGNRVWNDTNSNGIQDAGEAGISGVTVQLYNAAGTTLISSATTDANGNYIFSSGTGTSTAAFKYGITQLVPNTNFIIRVPTSTGGLNLTTADAGSKNTIDSDAPSSGDVPVLASEIPLAGANNHTFDIGFTSAPPCPEYCLFTSSWSDNLVLKYDGTVGGSSVQTFGSSYIQNSYDMAIGPDGMLYVASYNGHKVVKFNPSTGAYINDFVTAGSGGLVNPAGIVFGPDGNLYVADNGSNAVYKYNGTTGASMGKFVDNVPAGLSPLQGLEFGPDGNLYVVNEYWQIEKYNGTTGAHMLSFTSPGGHLQDIIFGSDGNLYLVEQDNNRVTKWNPTTGTKISDFIATPGGSATTLTGATFGPDGNFYLAHWSPSGGISKYNGTTGAYIGEFASVAAPKEVMFVCGACTVGCSLTSPGKTNETCNNNGTPAVTTDDYITFSLNPKGTGLGTGYTVSVNNGGTVTPSTGSYGGAIDFRLQNGSANGTTYTITVTDNATGACQVTTTVQQNPCGNFIPPVPTCTPGTNVMHWTQSINPVNGDASVVKLYCQDVLTYTIPSSNYPALLTSGVPVTVNISEVVSYDGYPGRSLVTQNDERWRIIFKKSGATVGTTGYTNDLPDLVEQGSWIGPLGSLVLPAGADEIILEHWSVGNGGSCPTPNSVVPTSVCLTVTSNCNLTSAGKTNEACNNNGTLSNGADDYITFSLNPTGTGLGTGYTVSASGGATVTPSSGTYGSATNFRLQNGSANGTTYTITVTDNATGACQVTTTVMKTSCSTCPPPDCLKFQVIKNNN